MVELLGTLSCATVDYRVFVVPPDEWWTVTSIFVANSNVSSRTYNLRHRKPTEATSSKQYLVATKTIAGSSDELRNGLIGFGPLDELTASASFGTSVAINVYGYKTKYPRIVHLGQKLITTTEDRAFGVPADERWVVTSINAANTVAAGRTYQIRHRRAGVVLSTADYIVGNKSLAANADEIRNGMLSFGPLDEMVIRGNATAVAVNAYGYKLRVPQ